MSKLFVERSGRVELEVSLEEKSLTVGRDSGNDVVLLDPSVSRRHARIDPTPSGYRIVDLDSGNGILHDGKRVPALDLVSGSAVGIGEFTLRFELDDPRKEAASEGLAKLVVIGGGDPAVYTLTEGETVVGRSSSADVRVTEPLVSSTHFKIVKRGSVYALVDLGSENGTYVNGVRTRETALHKGDQIRVAGLTFYFAEDGVVPEPGTVELIQPVLSAAPKRVASDVPPSSGEAPPAPETSPSRGGKPAGRVGGVPRIALVGAGLFAFLLLLVVVILLQSPENDAEREFQDVFQANLSEEEQARIEDYQSSAKEYEARGNFSLALEQYRKILTLDPTQHDALAETARLEELLEKRRAEEEARAREERERLAQVAELTDRADALVEERKFDEARALLDQAMTLVPDSETVKNKLVASFVTEGDYLRRRSTARARAAYQKALELDPGNEGAKRGIQRIGRSRRAAQREKARVEELMEAGLGELRQEDYRDAYRSFSEVLKLDPGNARAKEFRDQAQALLEEQVRPIYEEGVRLYNAGELAAAMERFQRALALQPDHADTKSFLSSAMERVRSEAVDRYKRAYIYEGLGRLQEALELYNETLALLPDPKEEYHQKAAERVAELKRKMQ